MTVPQGGGGAYNLQTVFQKPGVFSTPFRWQRNAVKARGAGSSAAAELTKSLVLLSCMG